MGEYDSDSELNNQGDYISGNIGKDGKDVVVGKNIDIRRKRVDQHNDQRVEVNLPELNDRQPKLADIYTVLAGDPLRGTPGLVSKVNQIDKRLVSVEEGFSVVKMQLISIEELVVTRNEQRGQLHITPTQFLVFICLIILIVLVVSPWLQAHLPKGPINGSVGYSILFRSYSRLYRSLNLLFH